MEMQKQERFYWIFPDTIKGMYEFVGYINDFKTRTNKNVPVVVLMGQDKDGRVGDFISTIWNIKNWNELLNQLGNDDKNFIGKRFDAIKEEEKIKLVLAK